MDVRLEKVNQSGVSATSLHACFHFSTLFLPPSARSLSSVFMPLFSCPEFSQKPLKKRGKPLFLLQPKTDVLSSSLFHLHLTLLLISSSSNWNTLWKPLWLTVTRPSFLPSFHSYFLSASFFFFSLAQLVVFLFPRSFPAFIDIGFLPAFSWCVLVPSVLMTLPSASQTTSEASSDTSFALPLLHPVVFFFSPVEILMLFASNDRLALKHSERTDQLVNWKLCLRNRRPDPSFVRH